MGSDGGFYYHIKESKGPNNVNITIVLPRGSKLLIHTDLDSTVTTFKQEIAQKCRISFSSDRLRLIFSSCFLNDNETLRSYGLEDGSIVYLVLRPKIVSRTNATGGIKGTNNTRSPFTNEGGGLGASSLGLNGARGSDMNVSFGSGLPNLQQLQQPFHLNPNLIREQMNTPAVQSVINYTDTMQSNPWMRANMGQYRELAHIRNDPRTVRETLEVSRNPEVIREMFRNTDRAMSNVESSPEGFNMQRPMYENATMTVGAGNDGSKLSGTQVCLANNRSTNFSSTSSEAIAGSPSPNTSPVPNPWNSTKAGWNAQELTALGFDLTELEALAGTLQDHNCFTQINRNQNIAPMLQRTISNLQTLDQIISANAELRGIFDSASLLRQMKRDPGFLIVLSSPMIFQYFLAILQAGLSLYGQRQSTQESGQADRATNVQYTPNSSPRRMNGAQVEMSSSMA